MESTAIKPTFDGEATPGLIMASALSHSANAYEDLATITLDERGMICDCSRASESLFKYRRSELVWRHVSMLLPGLETWELIQNGQPNSRLRFLCRTGLPFQAVPRTGERFHSNLFFNLRGEVLPFVRLRELFDVRSEQPKRENVVVVKADGRKAGIVVDVLQGEFQTVIKPLGTMFRHLRGISGSTILGSGDVALIPMCKRWRVLPPGRKNARSPLPARAHDANDY